MCVQKELRERLQVIRVVSLTHPTPPTHPVCVQKELRERLQVIRLVLETGGHFRGVNRKVGRAQSSPMHGRPATVSTLSA